MKKRIIAIGLCLLMAVSLCACDGDGDIKNHVKGLQDTVSKYGQQIEDSKEQLEDAAGKLQDILNEAKDKLPAD